MDIEKALSNITPESLKEIQKSTEAYEKSQRREIARAQFEIISIEQRWTKTLDYLKSNEKLQLTPDQIKRMKNNLRDEYWHIQGEFLPNIHSEEKYNELYKDLSSFFYNIDSDLDIAILKGEQNNNKELFQQKMELRQEWRNLIQVIVGPKGAYVIFVIIIWGINYLGLLKFI